MKIASKAVLAGVLLFGATSSVFAGSLLGIVGDKDSGALVTLGSGGASGSGLVNVGLGGGGGNLVDANVGGTGAGSIAKANVSTGGGSVLGANVGLLNNSVRVNATVGGGSLANVGVNIGGGGNGPGNGGGAGPGQGGNGPGVVGNSRSDSSSFGAAACVGTPVAQIDRLIRSTRVDASWQRASNVSIQPVAVCPDVRVWLARQLAGSSFGSNLQWALRNDVLASASLSRTSYGADRVFAVQRSGAQLTLFVY